MVLRGVRGVCYVCWVGGCWWGCSLFRCSALLEGGGLSLVSGGMLELLFCLPLELCDLGGWPSGGCEDQDFRLIAVVWGFYKKVGEIKGVGVTYVSGVRIGLSL